MARSAGDKLPGALRITEVYLPNELRTQFRQLFSAQNAAITSVVIGAWAAGRDLVPSQLLITG